jgi:hypothetical protein
MFHPWKHIMYSKQIQLFLGAMAAVSLLSGPAALANPVPTPPPAAGDIPADFKIPTAADDYVKRDVMIPMRDGVKLHTVIVIPKGATRAPMILNRTPYDASKFVSSADSPRRARTLPRGHGEFADAGHIIVTQDVRGKYQSEGDYVMNRPLSGR